RTLSYPHACAQKQQQQRRAGQTRMGIGYAANKMASNLPIVRFAKALNCVTIFGLPRAAATRSRQRTRSYRRFTVTTRTRAMGVLFAVLFCFAPAFAQITVQGGADDRSPAKQEDHPSSITLEFQMT